jgi:DNA polymerase IV
MPSDLPTPPGTGHGPSFSLKGLPPIYVLPTHLNVDELHKLEEEIIDLGALFTYDAKEAKIFLGKVERKTRAAFELRSRGVWTEENVVQSEEPPAKRRRASSSVPSSPPEVVTISDTESEAGTSAHVQFVDPKEELSVAPAAMDDRFQLPDLEDRILVIKLGWLDESLRQHRLLPVQPFIVYDGRVIPKPNGESTPTTSPSSVKVQSSSPTTPASSPLQQQDLYANILKRAQADAEIREEKGHPVAFQHRRRFNQQNLPPVYGSPAPKLKRMTTSEYEETEQSSLPDPPDWVKNHAIYACHRSTPLHPINYRFISELLKIKESRILTLDQIGVRAYATSIASLAAYPYLLQSPLEVIRLPGCDERIASHFSEYKATSDVEEERYLPVARKLDEDENLQHLKTFYNIWGCGADTARKMYFTHGWKDIDDVVQFGWNTLNRAQQIGVKFYDEFLVTIPRPEVEQITEITKQHARKCRGVKPEQYDTNADIVAVIVGGYRRGKDQCGDVDMILSHRDESLTRNLVVDVVAELEESGYVTHTLTLNTTTSKRGQQTLPYTSGHGGHGFDSLDKALCVWQDPVFSPPPDDPEAHNPSIHRRVDIIISPWRTVGAAILGWSGGNTFQRDIRRWCKRVKAWKFDSSGVRDRRDGVWLDLEAPVKGGEGREGNEGDSWLDRERRLMERLGIGWRPATERCTG